MMEGLLNAMRLQAIEATDGKVMVMLGVIKGYNPNNYTAKVLLQPDGTETEFLPVATPWVGNGWGMFCPPSDGDLVKVHFLDGDISSGIISLRLFSNAARPANVPSGEFQIIHKSGSALKFHNDGSVELITHAGLTATVGGNAAITCTGKATITATEIDLVGGGGTAKGLVQGDCVCSFTGAPHAMISTTTKGTV